MDMPHNQNQWIMFITFTARQMNHLRPIINWTSMSQGFYYEYYDTNDLYKEIRQVDFVLVTVLV
jgi:hypothetical protein